VLSLRSWSIRGLLVLALVALGACGGGSGDDDGPSDVAKDACERYGDFLAEAARLGGTPTREQAEELVSNLRGIAADAEQASEDDSAYFALANALDQLLSGFETANQAQIDASNRTIARQCLDLFPELGPTESSAPASTEATEP
jgi:hypothetical protein